MDFKDLTCAAVSIESGVADVVLTATGKANRMGPDYWFQMPTLFSRLEADDAVRAIVIRGGEHFTYGLDLPAMGAELAQFLDPAAGAATRTKLLDAIRRLQQANTAVARCRKPVIAAVSGWCIGGGVDLITACDIRLCSKDAKFSVREVRLAMVADVGTLARLPPIVGQGVARELAFTGDDFDAARALRIGLVSEVFPTPAELIEAARALASRIAKNPPLVVQGIKEVLNAGSEPAAAASLATVALWNSAFLPSLDVQEAIGAFLEKREPQFRGQ
ncbi:MAG: enoyl-CoA hydratase [Myxococcaceae bacterium]|nr:enoyl-CoA hydratase [Myxococcaceae bacterium]